MPQIWMTYDEIAGLLDCSIAQARERVVERQLDRKVSRDGKTRAKLSVELIGVFFDHIRASEYPLDLAVDGLRRVHRIMSKNLVRPDRQGPPLHGSADRKAVS
jgi:hypothetical protein